jgi:hypothetical protein
MVSAVKRFGYVPNPAATEQFVRTLRYPSISNNLPHLLETNAERDAVGLLDIWLADPVWKREAQGIGDCVAWAGTGGGNTIYAGNVRRGEARFDAWFSEEGLYGLRVETDPRTFANYEDGWYGSGVVKAMLEYGLIPKKDWREKTGNPEHDLRKYNAKRAKEWGRWGAGGRADKGKLDAIAKKQPIKEASLLTKLDSAEAVLDHQGVIVICSDVGFEDRQGRCVRDSEGVVRPGGKWPHSMFEALKIWRRNRRLWLVTNSWGTSVSGPQPYIEELVKTIFQKIRKAMKWAVTEAVARAEYVAKAIGACSFFIDDEAQSKILRQRDSFGIHAKFAFDLPVVDWDRFLRW